MRGFMVAMTGDRIRPEGFDHPSHTLTCLRPTLDQYVATHEQFYGNSPSRFRSLCLGVSEARFHDYGHWNAISFTGPDSPVAAVHSPAQLYSMLFDVPAYHKAMTSPTYTTVGVGRWGGLWSVTFAAGPRLSIAAAEARDQARPQGEILPQQGQVARAQGGTAPDERSTDPTQIRVRPPGGAGQVPGIGGLPSVPGGF